VLPLLALGCTSSPEAQLKEALQKELKQRYESYRPKEISIVDTLYPEFKETDFFKESEDQMLRLEGDSTGKAIMMRNQLGDEQQLKRQMDSITRRLSALRDTLRKRRETYAPRPSFFLVEHRFEAEKKGGGKLKGLHRIKVDTNYQVVNIQAVEDSEPPANDQKPS
jgi:hypothetical protein